MKSGNTDEQDMVAALTSVVHGDAGEIMRLREVPHDCDQMIASLSDGTTTD